MEELFSVLECMRLFDLRERAIANNWDIVRTMYEANLSIDLCETWLSLFHPRDIVKTKVRKISIALVRADRLFLTEEELLSQS